jgi:hypothetical protein
MIRFSLSISHCPWRPERRTALAEMIGGLIPLQMGIPFFLNDADYRGQDWQKAKVRWALDQWAWHLSTPATSHHVLMTDDLAIAPDFWPILSAMVTACPEGAIGLLSNHPDAPDLASKQWRWYRCNAWIVGPAYVVPRGILDSFVQYFWRLPEGNGPGCKGHGNDDSTLNEFLTATGRHSYHPLPTIIEHRGDLESTVGHGDRYSRERVSWRAIRKPHDIDDSGNFAWRETPAAFDLLAMRDPDYWRQKGGPAQAPMLHVGIAP